MAKTARASERVFGPRWRGRLHSALGLLFVLGWACGADSPASTNDRGQAAQSPRDSAAPVGVTVIARYPHDPDAFTQGLLWLNEKVYESTGQYGASRLRIWDLETGAVEQERPLPPDLFGEGLALVPSDAGGELVWLTWQAGRALRFDPLDLSPRGEWTYDGEGWGLAFCRGELFRSDGSAVLWRHDPETFAVLGRLDVTRNRLPVVNLNELECTPRGILANVWQSDEIVRIDPNSGRVTETLFAGGLLEPRERRFEGVLNGIAYRSETDTLLVTGKYWPWLFEVVPDADGP